MRDDNKILARPSQPSPIPLLVFGWQLLQVATVHPCASLVCERESLAGPLSERMSARAHAHACVGVWVYCVCEVSIEFCSTCKEAPQYPAHPLDTLRWVAGARRQH
jgi:hypothetical protein